MDPKIESFSSFSRALIEATNYDEVIKVCRAIDIMNLDRFKKHYEDYTMYTLSASGKTLTRLLVAQFHSSKDLSFHVKVMEAIMKPGLCLNYLDVEFMLNAYNSTTSGVGAECLRIYGWLKNFKFITKFGVRLPSDLHIKESFQETSLKYSKDTRYFPLAIENCIMAYDTSVIKSNWSFLFPTLLTNLENSHQGVHKLLLDLFKRMVAAYSKKNSEDREMIETIIELPWTNRNKYQLLAILVSVNCDLLVKHPKFNMAFFLEGIQVGLTIHHLLAASQSLVKSIQTKDVFKTQLLDLVAKILWNGEVQLVQNVIKYWFSTFDIRLVEKLYTAMSAGGKFANVPTTSDKFYRLLILRNAFKRTFKDPELDARVIDFACLLNMDGVPMKIEIFHILMDNVHAETHEKKRLQNILTILKFLRFNMCIEESSFIDQHVMRKLPDFFNLLASKKLRNVKVLKEVFGIIETDIYQYGIELGTYESLSFNLKLLNIVLKQYFGESGSRLCKNTNVEGNLSFGKYLRERKIWNVTSSSIFMQLVKLVDDDEHSDISEMAVTIIVEYFIKKSLVEDFSVDGLNFAEWVSTKARDASNQTQISSATSTNPYYILKFEYSMTKDCSVVEVLNAVELLKSRFMKLKKDSNPVETIREGSHLFRLMDCINYGIKRLKPAAAKIKLIPVALKVLVKMIAYHFLDYISDPKVPPSFEILDEKLISLLGKSKSHRTDFAALKQQLTLFIWFTLRSSSEITETLAKICDQTMLPSEKEYQQMMETCIDINIQILTRCCHKGVIDSASSALGPIARLVSTQFSKLIGKTTEAGKNLHGLLVTLKHEIDCGKRPFSETGDIRSSRGLIVMAHKIISNHPPFLRFLMESLLVLHPINRFEDTQSIRFDDNIKPIQLHLLATLIKDGDLAEEMLKYYDFILLATFKAYKESKDFVMNNALLQIVGAIVPKIANQKSHVMAQEDEPIVVYEAKAVTVYEFYVKFTYSFRVGLLDLDCKLRSLSTTYIIILLEIFSNFEYRNGVEVWSEIERMPEVFKGLMRHSCEKIRFLAAKCYAQWRKVDDDMLALIKSEVNEVFSSDGNLVHSTIHSVRFMKLRYESNVKFVKSFNFDDFVFESTLRTQLLDSFEGNERKFIAADNFYIRYHLLDFLTFLGFSFDSEIVESLMMEKGLQSHLGYEMWSQKVKELSTK